MNSHTLLQILLAISLIANVLLLIKTHQLTKTNNKIRDYYIELDEENHRLKKK